MSRLGALRRQVSCVCITLVLLVFALAARAQPGQGLAEIVIGPPGDGMRDLFEHPESWPRSRALTGALIYADHNLTHLKDDELRRWFEQMRGWNLRLELEVGAIKKWAPNPDAIFAAEQPLWDRAIRLGANLASVALDEPLVAARSLKKHDSDAVEETARFIQLARQRYPTLRIGDIEPYPSFPVEDHVAWISQLQARLRALGVRPLDFYRVDVDWVAFAKADRGSWRGVARLAGEVRKAGLPFSLIYWASGFPSEKAAGLSGEDTWYIETMAQGYSVADAGLRPDQFVLQSWIGEPPRVLPEDREFTFTRSLLDFARKFAGQRPH